MKPVVNGKLYIEKSFYECETAEYVQMLNGFFFFVFTFELDFVEIEHIANAYKKREFHWKTVWFRKKIISWHFMILFRKPDELVIPFPNHRFLCVKHMSFFSVIPKSMNQWIGESVKLA